jgi:hypothetical protein
LVRTPRPAGATVESTVLAARALEPEWTSCGLAPTTKPDVDAPIDANGNLTADASRTFEWDARNQLIAVTAGV